MVGGGVEAGPVWGMPRGSSWPPSGLQISCTRLSPRASQEAERKKRKMRVRLNLACIIIIFLNDRQIHHYKFVIPRLFWYMFHSAYLFGDEVFNVSTVTLADLDFDLH